uniref:Nucleolar and coiled-body phosphoprotein 1 n=1 Tax=Macrostomum lignano TaxID=282301 RepID=A0A1I8IKX1_9PLAT
SGTARSPLKASAVFHAKRFSRSLENRFLSVEGRQARLPMSLRDLLLILQQQEQQQQQQEQQQQLQKQLLPKLQKRQGKQPEAAHSSGPEPVSQEQQQEEPEQKQIPLQQTVKQSSPRRKQKPTGKIATGRSVSKSATAKVGSNPGSSSSTFAVAPIVTPLSSRRGAAAPSGLQVQGDSGKQAEYNAEPIDDRPDPRQASNPLPSTPKEAEAEADNLDIDSGSNVNVLRVPVMPSEPGEADDRDDVAIEEEEEEAAAQDDDAPVNLSRVSLTSTRVTERQFDEDD